MRKLSNFKDTLQKLSATTLSVYSTISTNSASEKCVGIIEYDAVDCFGEKDNIILDKMQMALYSDEKIRIMFLITVNGESLIYYCQKIDIDSWNDMIKQFCKKYFNNPHSIYLLVQENAEKLEVDHEDFLNINFKPLPTLKDRIAYTAEQYKVYGEKSKHIREEYSRRVEQIFEDVRYKNNTRHIEFIEEEIDLLTDKIDALNDMYEHLKNSNDNLWQGACHDNRELDNTAKELMIIAHKYSDLNRRYTEINRVGGAYTPLVLREKFKKQYEG